MFWLKVVGIFEFFPQVFSKSNRDLRQNSRDFEGNWGPNLFRFGKYHRQDMPPASVQGGNVCQQDISEPKKVRLPLVRKHPPTKHAPASVQGENVCQQDISEPKKVRLPLTDIFPKTMWRAREGVPYHHNLSKALQTIRHKGYIFRQISHTLAVTKKWSLYTHFAIWDEHFSAFSIPNC